MAIGWVRASAIAGLASLASVGAAASDAVMRLHVGSTGIHCLRFPCPHRGVFIPGVVRITRASDLLYAAIDTSDPVPNFDASEPDRAALLRSWAEFGCTAIEGQFVPSSSGAPTIRVVRIVGDCR